MFDNIETRNQIKRLVFVRKVLSFTLLHVFKSARPTKGQSLCGQIHTLGVPKLGQHFQICSSATTNVEHLQICFSHLLGDCRNKAFQNAAATTNHQCVSSTSYMIE
jgi:hypothetical protein